MLRIKSIFKILLILGVLYLITHLFILYYYTPLSRRSLFSIPIIETPIDLIESVFKENRAFDSCHLPFAYGTVGMDSECSLQSKLFNLLRNSSDEDEEIVGINDISNSFHQRPNDNVADPSQYNSDSRKKTKKLTLTGGPYLTPVFDGRLGNELFEYASSFAFARRYNYTLVLKRNCTPAAFHTLFEGGLSAIDAHSKNVCSRAGIYMV